MSGNNTTGLNMDLSDAPIHVWGLVGVIIFYFIILAVGIFASWKTHRLKNSDSEEVMLAGRDIGLFIGIFTMTATWVGGGYINGTAEVVYTPGWGLVWAQAPIGYAISLFIGGMLFAKQMREAGYVTMLDPFEVKYGRVMAALLYIPAFFGEVFWTGAILSALGSSLRVILNLDNNIAIIISASVSILYTFIGGLFSVAFTDIIQLICIFFGLWLGVGFAINHKAVTPISETFQTEGGWAGKLVADPGIGLYVDSYLLLTFGGIPWQAYFQRVLSSRTAATAKWLSFCAAFACIVMAIPAVILGAIGQSTAWNETDYPGPVPIPPEDYKLILPLVLQYLTPTVVSVVGLGAVSAAVMSSADSSILSASTMFAKNIYLPFREAVSKKKAGQRETIWVMRVAVVAIGIVATFIAITVQSIYALFYLCGDLVYVILFPQLFTVIHVKYANTYGSITGYTFGWILRITGGEVVLGIPAVIKYPYWYEDGGDIYQNFPFKTMIMLINLVAIIGVSALTSFLFKKKYLPQSADILNVFEYKSDGRILSMGERNPAFLENDEQTAKL